jgi:hypothetical protein
MHLHLGAVFADQNRYGVCWFSGTDKYAGLSSGRTA